MSNVVDYWEWRRARLGGGAPPVRSPRPSRSRVKTGLDFIRIGTISDDLVRRLQKEK